MLEIKPNETAVYTKTGKLLCIQHTRDIDREFLEDLWEQPLRFEDGKEKENG